MEALKNTVTSVGTTVVNGIVNGFTNVLKTLFIPSDDYFSKKLEPIQAKFGFVKQIVNFAKSIISMLSNDNISPPSFTFDLSKLNTRYYMGDSVTIDFNWYAPYRNSVNSFLSGFIWLHFIWNSFKSLPSIISGGSGLIDSESQKGDN